MNEYLKIFQFARLISDSDKTKMEIQIGTMPFIKCIKVHFYPEGFNGKWPNETHTVNYENKEELKSMATYLNNLLLIQNREKPIKQYKSEK